MNRTVRLAIVFVLYLSSRFQTARADERLTVYGKTVDGWITVLRDKTITNEKRVEAVRALGWFGP